MKQRELTPEQRKYFGVYRPKNTDRDWDLLRMRIPSIDIFTLPLAPLYMEVIGKPWPGKRRSDPIESYFELSYEELVAEKKMRPKEIDLMIDLVSRVVQTEEGEKGMVRSERINKLTQDFFLNTLEKFDIRPDLPIDFIAIGEESRILCAGAGADDLEKVLRHGIFLLEKKFLSGELKDLFNAVSTESPQLMARFLPVVPGERGVKPWKAMEICLQKIPANYRVALAKSYSKEECKLPDAEEEEFQRICKRMEMVGLEFRALFPEESRAIREGEEGKRDVFHEIRNDEIRALATSIIEGKKGSREKKAPETTKKRASYVSRLFHRVGAS